MAINQATICGNLTRDAEGKNYAGGYILRFTVAVNEWRKVGEKWESKPNYIPCVMFGTRAEKVAQFMKKGIKVCVIGSLKYSEWMKEEEKRSKIEIFVRDLELMQKKDDSPEDIIPF